MIELIRIDNAPAPARASVQRRSDRLPAGFTCACPVRGYKNRRACTACVATSPMGCGPLGCECRCHAALPHERFARQSALQALELSALYDRIARDHHDPTEPAHALAQVVLAHLSDALDALRVLSGDVKPGDGDWDVMPADVQAAAATLYPSEVTRD